MLESFSRLFNRSNSDATGDGSLPPSVFKKYRKMGKKGQIWSIALVNGQIIEATLESFDPYDITISCEGEIRILQRQEIKALTLKQQTQSPKSPKSPNVFTNSVQNSSTSIDSENSFNEDDPSHQQEGMISAWYPDRNYGFLWDNKKKKTLFFRRYNILDAQVLTSLEEGGLRQKVLYSILKTTGKAGKYDLAQIEELISESGFKQDVEEPIKRIALPTGNSLYDKAKRADLQGQLDLAETLYTQLIGNKTDPKYFTAIMDLASLQNRFDPNKAVETLKDHREEFPEERKLVVDRATVQYLYRAQRYLEAAELLKATMKAMELNNEMDESTRRHYTIQLNQCYENANRGELVQDIDGDPSSGHDNGSLDDVVFAPIQLLTNRTAGFSYILHLATTADYSSADFGIKTFDSLPESAPELKKLLNLFETKRKSLKQLWTTNSKHSADDFISYHSKCRTIQLASGSINLLLYANGVQNAQIRYGIKTSWLYYFAEDIQCRLITSNTDNVPKMLLAFGWLCRLSNPGAFLPKKMARLIYLYANGLDQASLIQAAEHVPKEILPTFSELPGGNQQFPISAFIKWLKLYDLLPYLPDLNDEFKEKDNVLESTQNLYSSYREKLLGISTQIKESVFLSGKNIDFLKETMLAFSERMPDEREVSQQADILITQAQNYAAEVDSFKKKEILDSFRTIYETALDRYVIQAPSLYSTELLFPVLGACLESLSSDMDRLASLPVELEAVHADSSEYIVENGKINLRLFLKSISVKAPPILKITTALVSGQDENDEVDYFEGRLIGGGKPHEVSLSIPISEMEMRDRAGTAKLVIKYQTILEQTKQVFIDVPFTIKANDQFAIIPNPYAVWSTGKSMKGEFFVGRQALLDEIEEVFTHGVGGLCYVLYGQTRSGKTSVKDNLLARLDVNTYAAVDIGETYSTVLNGDPFSRLVVRFSQKLPLFCEGLTSIPEELPQEKILQICENAKNAGKKVIVAIDEFTRLYEEACQSQTSKMRVRAFLRGIKSLLGEEAFHLIIIGQESMVQFRDSFPNEFAVTKFKRLSYLTKEDSQTLAEKPILNNGLSRYRGNAFDRLFELTAGYPYYMHIFCDHLVQFLNERKLPIVEVAQIDAIEKSLCSSDGRLSRAVFDSFTNLHLPEIKKKALADFYYMVANQSKESGWCALEYVRPLQDGVLLARILTERGILESIDDKIRIRMGLFASWLRANADSLDVEDQK